MEITQTTEASVKVSNKVTSVASELLFLLKAFGISAAIIALFASFWI